MAGGLSGCQPPGPPFPSTPLSRLDSKHKDYGPKVCARLSGWNLCYAFERIGPSAPGALLPGFAEHPPVGQIFRAVLTSMPALAAASSLVSILDNLFKLPTCES